MLSCTTPAALLQTTEPQQVVDFLFDHEVTESDGRAFFEALLAARPVFAHTVLCQVYDVCCYQVGESCFRDQAPAHEHALWFVSTADNFPAEATEPIPLAASLEAAQALAVQHLRLIETFFDTAEVGIAG